ncbi:Dbl homology domain-containing protein [Lentinula raphanica]|nr:Dbl homology domain-containing protein [Lentinula raphanica]
MDKSVNPSVPSSWRSLVGPERYRSFLDSCGELELQRQEVIWDLRTAETVFVDRLSCVVNLFIIPLRVHATKIWISGVPLEIAKVLDWLEDIINLHTQIRDTLQSFQTPESPFVGSQTKGHDEVAVAYALCACVHKLEIYQPYLVKLSGVLEMLHRLVKDGGSDFGEFVRMQEKSQECRMSFADMLQEPANRIVAYPTLFRVSEIYF